MDHTAHEPGTVDACAECRALSYEPGWYKAMRDERVVGRRTREVWIPEAGTVDLDVVPTEKPSGVTVPELEDTAPDEPAR